MHYEYECQKKQKSCFENFSKKSNYLFGNLKIIARRYLKILFIRPWAKGKNQKKTQFVAGIVRIPTLKTGRFFPKKNCNSAETKPNLRPLVRRKDRAYG